MSVHGTIGALRTGFVSPISSYSVDGSTPVNYRANQTQYVQYNQRFYQSPVLPDGEHNLIVTNTLYSDSLFLDYFVVQSETTTIVTGSNSPSSSSTSLPSTESSENSSIHKTTVIVGCIVGAVVGIVILLTIFFCFRRQKRRKQAQLFDTNMVSSCEFSLACFQCLLTPLYYSFLQSHTTQQRSPGYPAKQRKLETFPPTLNSNPPRPTAIRLVITAKMPFHNITRHGKHQKVCNNSLSPPRVIHMISTSIRQSLRVMFRVDRIKIPTNHQQ